MDNTSVSLKEHIETIINLRSSSQDKAMALYREEIERRLEGLNELRKEVTQDRGQFVKREVYDADKDASSSSREAFGKRLTAIETRIITWTSAIGLFFLIVNIIIHYFK